MVGITEKRSPIANKRKKLFWTNLFQSLQQEINFGEREREREREGKGVRRERYKKYCIFITIAQESETLCLKL